MQFLREVTCEKLCSSIGVASNATSKVAVVRTIVENVSL